MKKALPLFFAFLLALSVLAACSDTNTKKELNDDQFKQVILNTKNYIKDPKSTYKLQVSSTNKINPDENTFNIIIVDDNMLYSSMGELHDNEEYFYDNLNKFKFAKNYDDEWEKHKLSAQFDASDLLVGTSRFVGGLDFLKPFCSYADGKYSVTPLYAQDVLSWYLSQTDDYYEEDAEAVILRDNYKMLDCYLTLSQDKLLEFSLKIEYDFEDDKEQTTFYLKLTYDEVSIQLPIAINEADFDFESDKVKNIDTVIQNSKDFISSNGYYEFCFSSNDVFGTIGSSLHLKAYGSIYSLDYNYYYESEEETQTIYLEIDDDLGYIYYFFNYDLNGYTKTIIPFDNDNYDDIMFSEFIFILDAVDASINFASMIFLYSEFNEGVYTSKSNSINKINQFFYSEFLNAVYDEAILEYFNMFSITDTYSIFKNDKIDTLKLALKLDNIDLDIDFVTFFTFNYIYRNGQVTLPPI